MRSCMTRVFPVLFAVFVFCAQESSGLINPKFTPVHLVKQSDVILQLKIKPDPPEGKIVFTVENVLKGKEESKVVEVDLTASALPDHAKLAGDVAHRSQDKLSLMFVESWSDKPGEDSEGGEQAAGPGQMRKAFLHIDGYWFVLEDDKGVWRVVKESAELVATWNGGTDMLLRLTKCIMDDPDGAVVPVKTGTCWAHVLRAGEVAGKVAAAVPVDLKRTGVPLLFVASSESDRLFDCTGEATDDVTAKFKLHSKSTAFAWSDFNSDGRLDLASWDGKSLTLYLQGADGTYAASAGAKELTECMALTPLDIGTPPKPGLLVTTSETPLLLVPGPDALGIRAAQGDAPGKTLGKAGPCLVADFDGDSLPDIVQPFTRGSLFYKGTGAGVFKEPVACQVALGEDPARASIGDWNNDGLLDIFCTAKDQSRLWENLGEGRFADRTKLTGEMSYMGARRSVGIGCVADINNDGWQDLVILHDEGYPQVFFNRGFRSFGLSISMDFERLTTLLPEASEGQLAGCVADFTGDGAQDLATVLKDGKCVVVARMPTGADLCARVVVSPKARYSGPVRAWATADNRMLGAWNITAGSAPAFISRPDAGVLTIKWRFPGLAEQSTNVVVENKPVMVPVELPGAK